MVVVVGHFLCLNICLFFYALLRQGFSLALLDIFLSSSLRLDFFVQELFFFFFVFFLVTALPVALLFKNKLICLYLTLSRSKSRNVIVGHAKSCSSPSLQQSTRVKRNKLRIISCIEDFVLIQTELKFRAVFSHDSFVTESWR